MKRDYPPSPLVGVGAVVIKDGRVLLVQRNQEPGRGLWAIPGGLLELGERLQEAAEREVREETGLAVRAGEPFYTFDVVVRDDRKAVQYHYVIVDLRAEYLSGEIQAADDVSGAGWFGWNALGTLAVSSHTLKLLERIRAEIGP